MNLQVKIFRDFITSEMKLDFINCIIYFNSQNQMSQKTLIEEMLNIDHNASVTHFLGNGETAGRLLNILMKIAMSTLMLKIMAIL